MLVPLGKEQKNTDEEKKCLQKLSAFFHSDVFSEYYMGRKVSNSGSILVSLEHK